MAYILGNSIINYKVTKTKLGVKLKIIINKDRLNETSLEIQEDNTLKIFNLLQKKYFKKETKLNIK
jgi:hypothetical protein